MPIKRTHMYRGFAIVHEFYASDEPDANYERFVISRAGSRQPICHTHSLAEAQAKVDQALGAPAAQPAHAGVALTA
jgi:hypothetical protein